MNYDWNFSRLVPYLEAFLSGTAITLSLTLLVIVLGTFSGLGLGVAMRNKLVSRCLYPILDTLRALPPLVLLLFFYFSLTQQVIGVTFSGYVVAVLAFSLNLAAFVADLMRSAIESVPKPSIDAARALAMNTSQIRRYVVFPYVARHLLPAMLTLYIGTLKMTSLASVINVREVVYTAQTVIADVSRSLEVWVVVGLIYIVLVVPSTISVRKIEHWANRGRPSNFI